MSIKVYVAGASSERHTRAIPVIAKLRAAGVQITHDWTDDPGFGVDPSQYTRKMARESARLDQKAVEAADCVLLLAPNKPSTGAWVELGIALGQRIPVWVAGEHDCIFVESAHAFFWTDDEAVQALISCSASRAVEVL
jgi:hypothetical protein